MKIALVQMHVHHDKQKNIDSAIKNIQSAANRGADIIVLPEMFCCPYDNEFFKEYAEKEGDSVWRAMSKAASDNNAYLVAGSMPELDDYKIFNTSFVFDKKGNQVCKHRKMHLFDIDVEGGQSFCESKTFSAGDQITVFETEFCKIGVCICFDMRFPELSRLMTLMGAELIIVPAAFNMTTGPAHWEIMFRQRAVDNQVFTVGVAPARNEIASYVSYGNSIVVSPWSDIIYRAGHEQSVAIVDIDINKVKEIRKQLPLLSARRTDLYEIRRKRT